MTKKKPYYSIILPVYNVKDYLKRCMDSIYKNYFKNYEIILVDDGSTDGSEKLCDDYASLDSRVRVVHKANGGLSSARNAGIAVSEGEYVFFVDSDDWIKEDALRILYMASNGTDIDIIKFSYYCMPSEKKCETTLYQGDYSESDVLKSVLRRSLRETGGVILSAWSHIYRRDFLVSNDLRFISEREIGSEDYLFNFQAYMCCRNIRVIKECLYFYDLREGSLTRRYRKNLPQQYNKLHTYFIEAAVSHGIYDLVKNDIAWSYIDKFMFVVLRNELIAEKENIKTDYTIKALFSQKELHESAKICLGSASRIKSKIILFMLKNQIKYPIVKMVKKSL